MKLFFALLFIVGMIPALYFGAMFAAYIGFFPVFAVPSFICVLLAGYLMHSYETDQLREYY